ncbi:FkbM family methyltransferase [Nostoc sp.]|uniref:FkbM family methyltransferase n=1 Tax=Nostoc sp. TaxID=1180 RepID=UPI002FF6D416
MAKFKKMINNLLMNRGYQIRRLPNFREDTIIDSSIDQKKIFNILNIKPSTIFDVGANVGQTAVAYNHTFPNCNIYSFEPSYKFYNEMLSKCINSSNIHPINVALDSKIGKATFFDTDGQTASLLPPSSDVANFYPQQYFDVKEKKSVETDTIDNFCLNHNISYIDILKLDVQGFEDHVLKGGENMLNKGNISLIFSEVSFVKIYANQCLFFELCTYLDSFNYRLFNIYEMVRGANGVLVGSDALFIKNDYFNNVINYRVNK